MTEIPIEPAVYSQTFKVDLEDNTYNFRTIYNSRVGVWTFDLSDEAGTTLAGGVTMVLGADLIDQYNLGIGALIMAEEGITGIDAGPDDLGSRILLIHLTEEEKEAFEAQAEGVSQGFPFTFPVELS